MPYRLTPNKFFVKDPNGPGYLPQNVVGDGTIADIEAAIQAKGAEVIATLPADYTDLQNEVEVMKGQRLTPEIKQAILSCMQIVAWTSEDGQTAYDALVTAFNRSERNLVYITVTYTQSGTVYTTDALSTLKNDLTVVAAYTTGETEAVTGYTLAGDLTEGTSAITVVYGGKTAVFNVTVTDASLLYSLPQETVFMGDVADVIDSDVVVLPTDRDTTFMIDFTPATPLHEGDFMFYTGITSSPYNSICIKCYNSCPRVETHSSGSGFKLANAAYGDRVRLVIRYTQGASVVECFYKPDNGVIASGTSRNTGIISANSTMKIGGVGSGFNSYNGTISIFKVYSRKLTDDEVNAFLTEEVA